MKTSLLVTITFLINLTISLQATAGDESINFEKVTKKDLSMKKNTEFPEADAIILHDRGIEAMQSDHGRVNYLSFKRRARIKIFNKKGIRYATFKVSCGSFNKLKEIEAYTYNLENDRIVKTKLKESDIKYEEVIDGITYANFAMPKVKEGSVIDVYYERRYKNYLKMQDWHFQHEIPVKHSHFEAKIPELFQFNVNVRGFHKVAAKPVTTEGDWFNAPGNSRQETFNVYEFVAKNIPAFNTEPYISSAKNFITRVTFDLRGYNSSYTFDKYVARDWKDVSKLLLESSDFGRELKRGYIRKKAKELKKASKDVYKQIELARNYIAGKIRYNGHNTIYPLNGDSKNSFNNGVGNSAGINMNLISLLNKMDIETKAAVLSTRNHGYIMPGQASIDAVNYMLAVVETPDGQMLVDATEPELPLGMVPKRCLNGNAIILDKNNPAKIQTLTREKYERNTSLMLNITENAIQGQIKIKLDGYSSFDIRESINDNGTDKTIESLNSRFSSGDLSSVEFKNIDSITDPLTISGQYSQPINFTGNEKMLYIDAMFGDFQNENPFKIKTREYPVNFACSRHRKHQIIINLPAGYKVESLPKPSKVTLPGKAAIFSYSAREFNNNIVINASFDINKPMFLHESYPYIKKFFEKAVNKYSEKIVLRKINNSDVK